MLAVSKARQVEDFLRDEIRRKRWVPGDRMPGREELLEELGVSDSTLRAAVNTLRVEGVLSMRQRSGTFVARVPAAGSIAILSEAKLLESSVLYFDSYIVGAAHRLIEHSGFRPVMSIGHGKNSDAFMSSLHLFDAPVLKDTLGVLNTVVIADVEERLESEGVPCVNIEFGAPMRKHSVTFDIMRLYELGAGLLRSHGYDDFAVMFQDYRSEPVGEHVRRSAEEMLSGAQALLGLPDDRWVPVPFTVDQGNAPEIFRQWWGRPDRPRAIFFADDNLFMAAGKAMTDLGIRVPQDLAVVTQSNAGMAHRLPMPVARVEFDLDHVVSAAWEMLRKRIDGRPVEQPVVYIPPTVRSGDSL